MEPRLSSQRPGEQIANSYYKNTDYWTCPCVGLNVLVVLCYITRLSLYINCHNLLNYIVLLWATVLFAMCFAHILLHCTIIASFNLFFYVCLPIWRIKIINGLAAVTVVVVITL